jgi:hypothetical protein
MAGFIGRPVPCLTAITSQEIQNFRIAEGTFHRHLRSHRGTHTSGARGHHSNAVSIYANLVKAFYELAGGGSLLASIAENIAVGNGVIGRGSEYYLPTTVAKRGVVCLSGNGGFQGQVLGGGNVAKSILFLFAGKEEQG